MPEGDTIFRTARTLDKALAQRRVLNARSSVARVRAGSLIGAEVRRVEARGKHLLIHFEDGRALHSHMGMHGSWHIYRPGERWQRSPAQGRCVLETDEFIAVCFGAPTLELLSRSALLQHERLRGLGPDVIESENPGAGIERLRQHGELPIGEALMQQSIVAGIGNVYKSEVLFLCAVSPFSAVSELSEATLERLLDTAQRLLRRNLSGSARRTRHALGDADRYWVYRRSGSACHRCATTIRMRRQGAAARSTYYCPTCQAVVD
ncbi:MAG TPA: DNA-formamidopyrimidine glycosylase family protein [Polyangiaceae bacterium]|nr:DNA-formamidopyrimidine glycosylase family protein [Polyangiaceae bacterium]